MPPCARPHPTRCPTPLAAPRADPLHSPTTPPTGLPAPGGGPARPTAPADRSIRRAGLPGVRPVGRDRPTPLPAAVLYATCPSTHAPPGSGSIRSPGPAVSVGPGPHPYEQIHLSRLLALAVRSGRRPDSGPRRRYGVGPSPSRPRDRLRRRARGRPPFVVDRRRPACCGSGRGGGPVGSSSDGQVPGGFGAGRDAGGVPGCSPPAAPRCRAHTGRSRIRWGVLPCRADDGHPPEPLLSGRPHRHTPAADGRSVPVSTEQDGRVTRLFLVQE